MEAAYAFNVLKIKLDESIKPWENSLLAGSYTDIMEIKRAVGVRDALKGIRDSLDNILQDIEKSASLDAVID